MSSTHLKKIDFWKFSNYYISTWIVTLMTLNCNHILPSFIYFYWICFILYRSCPICQKSCKGRYYYQHIKSHDSSSYSHICKDCGDMFLTKYKLIEHQSLVHTGEASRTFCFVYTLVILALLIYHNMERYLRVGK